MLLITVFFQVQLELVEDFIHLMHEMWVLHHEACVEANEIVFAHIVSQVGEDESALLGFIDRRTVDFDIVSSPINIVLLSNVVDHLGRWHNSAIANIEMEECQ